MKRSIVFFTSLAVLMACAAFAPPAHARSSKRARIKACSDKSAGDACTYTSKGADVNGTCESGRRGKLICTASSAGAGASSGAAATPPEGSSGGSEMGGPPPAGAGGGAMGSPPAGSPGSEAPPPSSP
ncbi:MAG TPA: hypothetical protein VKB84_00850 [Candidatus Binataceae bacterium]|nr:hypothetical protein [Candidatus Binataceae bacterium]